MFSKASATEHELRFGLKSNRFSGSRRWVLFSRVAVLCCLFAFFSFLNIDFFSGVWVPIVSAQSAENTEVKKTELEQQIKKLENESKLLDGQLQVIRGEGQTLANETKALTTEINKKQVEINRLSLIIRQTGNKITSAAGGIDKLAEKIDNSKKALSASIVLLYAYDQENTLMALLRHNSLSNFFSAVDNVEKAQSDLEAKLKEFKEDKAELEREKTDLEDFKTEQQELQALQEVERRTLNYKKQEKQNLLTATKGKESVFQQLLNTKKRNIAALQQQLYYLEKSGVAVQDAVQAADYAAQKADIRTAFLLALLEVETGKQFEDGVISAGTNVGTGNWKTDLYDCYVRLGRKQTADSEKNAFFKITSALGMNPDTVPVSRKPSYGCGGAMGAAQFLPTTWLRYADKVANLTGHNPPNPWNVEDAFTAAAVLLADAGATAKTPEAEIKAAKVYISGRSTCSSSICNWYSSQILSLAKDIDRIL